MSQNWTDSELTVLENMRPVCTTREIQKVLFTLGFTRSLEAISKKANKSKLSFSGLGEPNWMDLSTPEKKAIQGVIAARVEHFEQVLTPTQKGKITAQVNVQSRSILQELEAISKITPKQTSYQHQTPKGLSLVALLSDFHIGKVVKTVTGEVAYNTEIGLGRIYQTVDLIQESTKEKVDELIINLAGDHIDGEGIYPGQDVTLEIDVATQVFRTTEAVWKMLVNLRNIYPKVRVVAVRGNHGRTKLSKEANFDTMLLQSLKLISNISKSDIHIDFQYGEFNTCNVQGWKLMTRHWAPNQAETPSSRARLGGWFDMHNWDILTYGHFHHWGVFTYNEKVIVRNGSLVGGDDYSEGFGASDSPTQMIFGVTPTERAAFIKPMRYE